MTSNMRTTSNMKTNSNMKITTIMRMTTNMDMTSNMKTALNRITHNKSTKPNLPNKFKFAPSLVQLSPNLFIFCVFPSLAMCTNFIFYNMRFYISVTKGKIPVQWRRGHSLTACIIQNGRQGAPKWPRGSGKVSTPLFLGTPVYFR